MFYTLFLIEMVHTASENNNDYDQADVHWERMHNGSESTQESTQESQSSESIKESIRLLDADGVSLEQWKLDASIIAEEKKLVFLWADWELFKIPANANLYKNDSLQVQKKKLYESSMYLNNLKKLTSKLDDTLTIYQSWNYQSLKAQWMDASKQAVVDWLKASLSLTADKAINTINKINPVERARKANTRKKFETIKKQWEDGKEWKAALTLVSSFTLFDRVLWLAQIARIKKFLTSPWMKFSKEIHALISNVAEQIQKHYRRQRIDTKTFNEIGSLVTEMYTTLTWWHTEQSTLHALAMLRA